MSRNPPLTYTQWSTWKPHRSEESPACPCVMVLGEQSGKACRAGRWDSFLQQCPQLVQLQLVRKFHLGFHCLPHSIPYYICNSLSEAHHYVSPLFLHSSPGLNAAMGKVWTASRINTVFANISAPSPPEAMTLLWRGQSCKPWVSTWKPLQKNRDPDFMWSHQTSQVHAEMFKCWWELCVPASTQPGFGVRPPLSQSWRKLRVPVSLSTAGGTSYRSTFTKESNFRRWHCSPSSRKAQSNGSRYVLGTADSQNEFIRDLLSI